MDWSPSVWEGTGELVRPGASNHSGTPLSVHSNHAACKSSSRGCFQISFKIQRFLSIREPNRSLHFPRSVFRSVGTFTGIVLFQAGFQIFSKTGVETVWIVFGLENIHVIEHYVIFHFRFAISGRYFVFSPPSHEASAWHFSLSLCESEKWRRRESNPVP